MIEHAVAAQQRGFWVFPTEPGDKRGPLVKPDAPPGDEWYDKRFSWSKMVTNSLGDIVRLWQRWPQANPAIAAKYSGLLIVDCDRPKDGTGRKALKGTPYEKLLDQLDGYVEGYDVFREMCLRSGGDWESTRQTYTVATGSGGLHFYYRWPVSTRASQASLLPGLLDIRCNGSEHGGYVLAPGSVTASGTYCVEDDVPIQEVPGWLVERVREREAAPRRQAGPVNGYYQPGRSMGNYEGIVDAVRYAADGNGNFMIFWAARQLYSDGCTEEKAIELMLEATAGWSGVRHSEKAVIDTVRSGYRAQQRKEG